MTTFIINKDGVTVTDDRGDTLSVAVDHPSYRDACDAVMSANWSTFANIALTSPDPDDVDDVDEFGSINIPQLLLTVSGLLQDEIISPEDLGMSVPATEHGHGHDLSQWNGSPIFYPTREMAKAQSDRWSMFWDYHDFGIASPAGYRYATVPRGVGPTAPKGYDWVCLPREES